MISVYQNKINNNLTIRDYDGMKKYLDLIQWGRTHPVQFIEKIFGVVLMDYQKWLISESWWREYVVWALSRNAGKSFLVSLFVMARTLLFPKIQVQIISENWNTAKDTFKKLEDIASNKIKTIVATNTVFIDELKKTKSDSDGFTHDEKNGHKCELLNGSKINTIAGSAKTARGRRSNVNVYDEAGFISSATYDVTEPYMSQDASFKLGANFDAEIFPEDIPNIRLYVGSASDTNSNFYKKYRDGTKEMLAGNPKYFVADLSCEIPKAPTVGGKKVTPLLSQAEIDRKMRENEIAANREYYNIFDHFDLEDCNVTKADMYANTEVFVPQLHWGGKKHKYIIAFDPASKIDNAPVLVMEAYKDANKKWCGRCIHMENLVITYGDGSKKPMSVTEQVQRLRELLYEYNGKDRVAPYENVTLLIDGGAGGQASAIEQGLIEDWTDANGQTHPGIYDEDNEYCVRWAEKYPRCIRGCMKVLEPKKYRNEMFEAAHLLVPLGAIKFAPPCPNRDVLVLEDGTERRLSKEEQRSLIQMDLMREEIAAMVRTKTPTGGVTYQLPPEKRGKMHDDRNYCFVMCCLEINLRRVDDQFGDEAELNYGSFLDNQSQNVVFQDPWLNSARPGTVFHNNKGVSPFKGTSPFVVRK